MKQKGVGSTNSRATEALLGFTRINLALGLLGLTVHHGFFQGFWLFRNFSKIYLRVSIAETCVIARAFARDALILPSFMGDLQLEKQETERHHTIKAAQDEFLPSFT